MEIMDKEQERIVKEQEEQSQKGNKKLFAIIGRIVFFAVLLIAFYFLDKSKILSGEPYPISVENITVIPGETTVQELAQAGYGLADPESREWVMENYTGYFYNSEEIDLTAEVEANSYYYVYLVKDGRTYAYLTIYNSGRSKPVTECKISSFRVASFDVNSDQAMILDIPFPEATEEAISERLGIEPKVSEYRTLWKKGKYSVIYEPAEEGDGKAITSEYEIN